MFSCTLIYVHPSFANSSSRCHGFVCSLRLSVFKIILTILTAIILGLLPYHEDAYIIFVVKFSRPLTFLNPTKKGGGVVSQRC